MLYYIVPPIVMIASLALLVIFLSRRTEAISQKINEGLSDEEAKKKIMVSKINRASLGVLEKGMYQLKLVFLKSYNAFDSWMRSIRKKRAEHSAQIAAIEQDRLSRNEDQDGAEVPADFPEVFERPTKIVGAADAPVAATPLVSEIVAAPDSKAVIPKKEPIKERPKTERPAPNKNKLEEALIERIAENPRDLEAYERLGEYYVGVQNFPDALECFRQVLKLAPSNRKAKAQVKKLEKHVLGW